MLSDADQAALRRLITSTVRVESDVKLAVACGPMSGWEGDPHACDEVVMIDCYRHRVRSQRALSRRIERRTEATVHVVLISDLRLYPAILSRGLTNGEVLKDNGGEWDSLQEERTAIIAAGDQQEARIANLFRNERTRRGIIRP